MAELRTAQLHHLRVGDDVAQWQAAGFTASDHAIRIGNTAIVFDPQAKPGIQAACISGIHDSVAGLAIDPDPHPLPEPCEHPNGITRIDHLVVLTSAVGSTSQALRSNGLDRRRTRRFELNGQTRRQDFFWLGDVIVEVAGPDSDQPEGKASYWGLALEADDFEATLAFLGSRARAPRPAVQQGRLIAGIETGELGITTELAVMSRHASSPTD